MWQLCELLYTCYLLAYVLKLRNGNIRVLTVAVRFHMGDDSEQFLKAGDDEKFGVVS